MRKTAEWLTTKRGDDRIRLFVRRWTPAVSNGCTVFCVHPVTATGGHFAFLARYLAHRGYTVVSPDLVGHGRSTYLRRLDAYRPELLTHTLIGITSRHSRDADQRAYIGSSWGAANLCAFLAATRQKATAVILNDLPMEWQPGFGAEMPRLEATENLRFETIGEAIEYLKRREELVFGHRDTDEISPEILDRFRASRLMKANGKYVLAFDPCVLAGLDRAASPKPAYPDFYQAISKIDSAHILLLFGEHSKFRVSKVRDRLVANRANVTALEVEHEGHAPRLLTDRQARLVHDFLEKARAA